MLHLNLFIHRIRISLRIENKTLSHHVVLLMGIRMHLYILAMVLLRILILALDGAQDHKFLVLTVYLTNVIVLGAFQTWRSLICLTFVVSNRSLGIFSTFLALRALDSYMNSAIAWIAII